METERKTQLLRQVLEAGFTGGESLTDVREKLGIDWAIWESWLRDGGVAEDVVTLAKAMAEMCAPWVWSSLLELTRGGNIPAMKLYFELCKEKQVAGDGGVQPDRRIALLRREILETDDGMETSDGSAGREAPADGDSGAADYGAENHGGEDSCG